MWPKKCYLEKEAIHGGAFNGNSCMTILKNVDLLKSFCPLHCSPFVELFSTFKSVVTCCFGTSVDPKCRRYIKDFRRAFKDTGLPVTPKLHMMFYYVTELSDRNSVALGVWSEQASEGAHSDFKVI